MVLRNKICDYKGTQMFNLFVSKEKVLNNFRHSFSSVACFVPHWLSQLSVQDEDREWKNVTVQIKLVSVSQGGKNKSTYSLMAAAAAAAVWQQCDAAHSDTFFDAAQISSAITRLDFQDAIIPPWNIEHFESMNKIPLILLF